jgi:hypothetical protein
MAAARGSRNHSQRWSDEEGGMLLSSATAVACGTVAEALVVIFRVNAK